MLARRTLFVFVYALLTLPLYAPQLSARDSSIDPHPRIARLGDDDDDGVLIHSGYDDMGRWLENRAILKILAWLPDYIEAYATNGVSVGFVCISPELWLPSLYSIGDDDASDPLH